MVNNILDIPIKTFLNEIGIETRKEGNRYFASSPFSRDSNWSFCIYPTNTYFDFANGHGGNILNLFARLNNCTLQEAAKRLREGITYEKYKPNYKEAKEILFKQTEFKLERYINTDPEECAAIKAYAESRGITEGYFCGVFFTRKHKVEHGQAVSKWIRVPALGFLHVDKDLKPCGIKLRRIDGKEPRFSARGSSGIYCPIEESLLMELTNTQTKPVVYVIEGEANANSLQNVLKNSMIPSIVISLGGVGSARTLQSLPDNWKYLTKKLIIDYDGNEELYQQRLALYKDLNAEPIKLILPKSEDINSLYCKGEMWKIENMLL